MNATDRILGEARKVRPPTKRELTDPHDAYFYAEEKLRMGRFPEGEAAIAKDPYWAYMYARHIIKGRWPEAEATIATDPGWAYGYAVNVLNGRWPEAEAVIATDPLYVINYAKYVIKGRWPEAEAAIATNPHLAKSYLELFPDAKLEWVMKGWLDWLDL